MDFNLLQILQRLQGWMGLHKALSAIILAGLLTGGVAGGVVVYEHDSALNVSITPASLLFNTTVTGIATNANQTPLILDGSSYDSSDITSLHMSANGNGSANSTITLGASGFLPGDFVELNVTITNTGYAALTLNESGNSYLESMHFYDSKSSTYRNVTGPLNGENGTVNYSTAPYEANFGNLAGVTASDFYNSYLTGQNNWVMITGSSAAFVPHALSKGESFTYIMFIGLGSNVPYPAENAAFSVTVSLFPAR